MSTVPDSLLDLITSGKRLPDVGYPTALEYRLAVELQRARGQLATLTAAAEARVR